MGASQLRNFGGEGVSSEAKQGGADDAPERPRLE